MLRLILYACFLLTVAGKKNTRLIDNGYEGVVIAINSDVPENVALIDAIKKMMTEASQVMYSATGARAYFKHVTILVPKTWTRGNYSSGGNETYDAADIRIAPPRPQLGDTPYAWGYGVCGKQGIYIHLTPAYVMDDSVSSSYGRRGRVMLHEWAHYRWGVKDEYPTGGTRQERHRNSFYLSRSGYAEATRCSVSVRGRLRDGDGECRYDEATRLPLLGCKFQYHETQPDDLGASLMYGQYLDKVTVFCHNDPSDPANMHNKEAPNNQNRQCDQKSAWEVIINSVDFNNGQINTPGSPTRNTAPTFKVVTALKKRVVLVLDTSTSMRGENIQNVKRVSEIFLRSLISDGTHVGLVKFSSSASVLRMLPLLEVNQNNSNREILVNALVELRAGGNTGIGSGIKKGIEVLEQLSANGGHLFVLTDGEETALPYVRDVADEAINKGVIVHAIFFGLSNVAKGQSLVTLSQRSGGEWYYSDDAAVAVPELTSIFAALARPDDGDLSSVSVQISSSTATLQQANDEISSTVALDGSVGNKTAFVFTWSSSEPTIELKPPSSSCIYSNVQKPNVTYCGMVHVTDIDAKTAAFNIPGKAKVGIWEYVIGNANAGATSITVTSAPSVKGASPIVVEPELSLTNVSGNEAAVVITTIRQNTVPVLGVTVTANITRPTGDPVSLVLLDNGAGADETKNDGVYSRYFSEFNAEGRYSIQVTAFKDGSDPAGVANLPAAPFNLGKVLDDGTFVPAAAVVNEPEEISGAEIDGALQRTATSAGLAYTGTVADGDNFPPNKITDLSAEQVDVDNADAGLRLVFTAPGDDYDSGTAARYDIRYSNGTSTTLRSNFESHTPVNSTTPNKPKVALSAEEIIIMIPDGLKNSTVVRIALAIRSFDAVENPSEVSNVVIVTYFLTAPPTPPVVPISTDSPTTQFSSGHLTLSTDSPTTQSSSGHLTLSTDSPTTQSSSGHLTFGVNMLLLLGAAASTICSSLRQ